MDSDHDNCIPLCVADDDFGRFHVFDGEYYIIGIVPVPCFVLWSDSLVCQTQNLSTYFVIKFKAVTK